MESSPDITLLISLQELSKRVEWLQALELLNVALLSSSRNLTQYTLSPSHDLRAVPSFVDVYPRFQNCLQKALAFNDEGNRTQLQVIYSTGFGSYLKFNSALHISWVLVQAVIEKLQE